MNIKIFVLEHAPCELPACYGDRSIYQPIQCGRAINEPIAGAIGDDEGDNISSLNVRYNEMTAIYWVVKHYAEIGNPDYIGFDHYRRFLNWRPEWLRPGNVVARRWFSWRPLRGQYACCHGVADLDRFSGRFRQVMGSEFGDYPSYWRTHFFYICNMFIMHRDDFARYSDFILRCIDILRGLELESPFVADNAYQNRIPSFIMETMTSYWIWHENRIGRVRVIPSRITHFPIENPNNGSRVVDRRGFLWFLRQAY